MRTSTHFPAITRDVSDIFEHAQNVTMTCDTLRLFRIAADRIAEGLTLYDVLSATTSWGVIAGRRKLKIV